MVSRSPRPVRWVLMVALVATGCTAHAAEPAGVRGPVGPQAGVLAAAAAPTAAAASASGAAVISGAPKPPSTIYGVAPDGALLPDTTLTPGVVDPKLTAVQLCKAGYVSAARRFSAGTKRQVFDDYAVPWATRAAYRVDDLVPLSLGGLPQHRNLWPVPAAGAHGIGEKDGVETRLRQLVCAGTLALATAQQALEADWFAAEQRYGTATPVPVVVTGSKCDPVGTKAVSKYATALVCAKTPSGPVVWVPVPPRSTAATTVKSSPKPGTTSAGAKATEPGTTTKSGTTTKPPGTSHPTSPVAPVRTVSPKTAAPRLTPKPLPTFKVPVAPPGLPPPAG